MDSYPNTTGPRDSLLSSSSASSSSASTPSVVSSGQHLNSYHPLLSTRSSDIRIQDAILEFPIVASIIVPQCDLDARGRAIALLRNVMRAANPALNFLLEFQRANAAETSNNQYGPAFVQRQMNTMLDHYRALSTFIETVNEDDSLFRFWLFHYQYQLEVQVAKKYGRSTLAHLRTPTRLSPLGPNYSTNSIAHMSLIALYSSLRETRDALSDLGNQKSGAVCIVFWSEWDRNYQRLAEILSCSLMISKSSSNSLGQPATTASDCNQQQPDVSDSSVGIELLERTQKGRIFQPSGTAALYVNRRKNSLAVRPNGLADPVTARLGQHASAHRLEAWLPDLLDCPTAEGSRCEPQDVAHKLYAPIENSIRDEKLTIHESQQLTSTSSSNSSAWPLRLQGPPPSDQMIASTAALINESELDGVMKPYASASEPTTTIPDDPYKDQPGVRRFKNGKIVKSSLKQLNKALKEKRQAERQAEKQAEKEHNQKKKAEKNQEKLAKNKPPNPSATSLQNQQQQSNQQHEQPNQQHPQSNQQHQYQQHQQQLEQQQPLSPTLPDPYLDEVGRSRPSHLRQCIRFLEDLEHDSAGIPIDRSQ